MDLLLTTIMGIFLINKHVSTEINLVTVLQRLKALVQESSLISRIRRAANNDYRY